MSIELQKLQETLAARQASDEVSPLVKECAEALHQALLSQNDSPIHALQGEESIEMKRKRLGRIVQDVQCDPIAWPWVERMATGILAELGIDLDTAKTWLRSNCQGKQVDDLDVFERNIHLSLRTLGVTDEHLAAAMQQRADMWYEMLQPHLPPSGTDILDYGGGSGDLSHRLQKKGFKPTVADVLPWCKYKDIPFIRSAKNHVAAPNGAWHTVCMMTVAHHSDDPAKFMEEAFRLARERVIFVESVTDGGLINYQYGSYIDWFYNNGAVHYQEGVEKKINVPCNFKSIDGWIHLIWQRTGLKPEFVEDHGFRQGLNPERHVVFGYQKNKAA